MATVAYDVRYPGCGGSYSDGANSHFNKIFSAYQPMIYRTCLGILRYHQDAEDATQETLILVWKKLGTHMGDSTLPSWIHRIAQNCSYTMIRERRLKRKVPADLIDPDGEKLLKYQATPDRYDPHEICMRDLRSAAVRAALKGIGKRRRNIIEFYASEEMGEKTGALAAYLGATHAGAKTTIYRTRLLLLQQLIDQASAHEVPSMDEFGIPPKFFAELSRQSKNGGGKEYS